MNGVIAAKPLKICPVAVVLEELSLGGIDVLQGELPRVLL
jgi:hypothetical protein